MLGAGGFWDPYQVVAITSDPALIPSDIFPSASVLPGKDGMLLRFPATWLLCGLNRIPEANNSRVKSQLPVNQLSLHDNVQLLLVLHFSDGAFTAGTAANLLGLPVWKLQAQLKEDGIDFKTLKSQLRVKLAAEMLGAQELTIREIAKKLGYSSASNFSRAFSKKTGFAPSDFCKKLGER
jgi:AraC-like DNA-binding protein